MYKQLVKKTASSCHAYFRRKSMRKRAVTRAELSCHTWQDRVNCFLDPWEWIDIAMKAGVRAIVIAMTGLQDVSVLEAAARDMEELRRKVKQETLNFKVIYGMETMLENGSSVNLLAKSQTGLEALYRLLEIAWQGREERPFLRKAEVNEYRTGLLVGCPGERGEVYRGILDNLDDARLEEIARFYDYLSVLPPQHYQTRLKLGPPPCGSLFHGEDMICGIAALGKKVGKPIVATGNERTANQDWGMFRTSANYNILKTEGFDLNWDAPKNSILCEMLKEEDLEWDGDTFLPDPLYAEELLDSFSFLGKDAAEEIVIHAPNGLADLCSEIRIVPEDVRCLQPILPNAFHAVSGLCREQLQTQYSGTIPEPAREQVEYELAMLQNNELLCSSFLISRRLVQGLQEKGYSIQTIAHNGSFFHAYTYVPYLLGVTTETVRTAGLDWDEGVGVPLELILSVSEERCEECLEDIIAIFAQIFPKSLAVSCENRTGWDENPSRSYRRIFVPDAEELRSWMPLQKTDNGYRIPYGRAEDFSNLFRVFLRPHRAQVCDTDWEDLLEQLGLIDR